MNNVEDVIINNDIEKFKIIIKNKQFKDHSEDDIIKTIVYNNRTDFLDFLLENQNLFFINYNFLIDILIYKNKYIMLPKALDYKVKYCHNYLSYTSILFNSIESESYECSKIILEHSSFDITCLNLDLLRLAAFKNNSFCFYFILEKLELNNDCCLDNLIKICIKNKNKEFLNKINKKLPNYKADFSFIYNSFKIINDENLDEQLNFMVENIDLSSNDNKLLKRYINSDNQKDINLIIKNKFVKESLTEKWINENCLYHNIKKSLRTIVLQNKVSNF